MLTSLRDFITTPQGWDALDEIGSGMPEFIKDYIREAEAHGEAIAKQGLGDAIIYELNTHYEDWLEDLPVDVAEWRADNERNR